MKYIIGILIGLLLYNCIIKPIKVHELQNDLIAKGNPKPKSYKEYIWF